MSAESMRLWAIIFAVGIGTFLLRYSFIAIFGNSDPPDWLKRALRFVPASVLSALAVPSIVLGGSGGFSWINERMWVGVVAALVAWRTKNIFATIGVGMVCLWIVQWVLG